MQRAGGVAALTQVALYLVTGLLLLLGLGPGGPIWGPWGAPWSPCRPWRCSSCCKPGPGWCWSSPWRSACGGAGGAGAGGGSGPGRGQRVDRAALLLASGGVGYATLTLYELFPQAEEAPGASSGPVSVISSALNAVVSGLGNAAVLASGCWALLCGWAGRRTRRLSPSLSVLLLVWGAAGVLTFVVPALVSLTLVLGLVALVWLGAVLLRPPGSPVPGSPP